MEHANSPVQACRESLSRRCSIGMAELQTLPSKLSLCLPLNSGSCLGLECLELSLGNIVVMTADLTDLFQLLDSFLVLPSHL